MCGIAGFLGFEDKGLLKRMCDVIEYRGPDDSGTYTDEHCSLGHRRLSIIDLEGGHQPMYNEDESIWIVYNGEIYNYLELKEDLEKKGHRFYTKSDTETIIHAYEEYGDTCVEHLRGMFAFAIWDSEQKKLLLARDRLGIKPLYYYFDGQKFIFSSEIKSIVQCPTVERDVDTEALQSFLILGHTPVEKTLFKGVKKLPPGYVLIRNREEDRIHLKEYWDLDFSKITNRDETYLVNKLQKNLEEVVEKHLISDVPLGAFLSGGVDSSCIVALMSKVTNPIMTFTIGFEDKSYDESVYAKEVSTLFNTEHYEKIITPEEILNLIESIVPMLDEPSGDIAIFPSYLVSQWARKKVKVALSGEGGDELFAGYHWYKAQQIDVHYSLLPNFMKRKVAPTMAGLLNVSKSKKGYNTVIKRFVEGTLFDKRLAHVRWRGLPAENELFKIKSKPAYDFLKMYFEKAKNYHPINQGLYVDTKTSLPEMMLDRTDKMSMLNSLEVRVPLLDHKIVEFAAGIPPNMKLKGLETKHILKKALLPTLPKKVLNRDKQGFSIPMKSWLKDELKSTMLSLLSKKNIEKRGFFDDYYIKKLIDQHIRNKRDNWHLLWRFMGFELWYRNYISP